MCCIIQIGQFWFGVASMAEYKGKLNFSSVTNIKFCSHLRFVLWFGRLQVYLFTKSFKCEFGWLSAPFAIKQTAKKYFKANRDNTALPLLSVWALVTPGAESASLQPFSLKAVCFGHRERLGASAVSSCHSPTYYPHPHHPTLIVSSWAARQQEEAALIGEILPVFALQLRGRKSVVLHLDWNSPGGAEMRSSLQPLRERDKHPVVSSCDKHREPLLAGQHWRCRTRPHVKKQRKQQLLNRTCSPPDSQPHSGELISQWISSAISEHIQSLCSLDPEKKNPSRDDNRLPLDRSLLQCKCYFWCWVMTWRQGNGWVMTSNTQHISIKLHHEQ